LAEKRQRALWHPSQGLVWLGIGLIWLLTRLPYWVNFRVSAVLGWCFSPLLYIGRRAQIAKRNLALCYPALDAEAQRTLLRANLRNTGHLLGEFAFAWAASAPAVAKIPADILGLEHLHSALAQGRGVILCSVHMSHLELCGRLLAERANAAPIAGMYRPHRSPAMEWMVRRWRLRYAQAMFTRDELRGCIRWLKAGNMLWYAPDQDYRRGDTVFAPFFGVPAASLTATHQLARMTGAAVVGFAHHRDAQGRFTIELQPALPSFPSQDAELDTTRVNTMLEAMIRKAPAQYLWLHQRFKTRPPGEPSVYQ
jgi:Kdo2-lipid IVA lauroyltransferase/acyltransferase